MNERRYLLSDLLQLMSRLRTPVVGCPWDLEQNYQSITSSTIEEVYEVVDAIEREDFEHLKEELGDLLFQVVFYAQLAQEEERFSFDDIVDVLTAKLLRRHPHVFPDGRLDSACEHSSITQTEEVLGQWEQIKSVERSSKGYDGVIDDVPRALPSLQRAQKLQKRVAKAGMDWSNAEDAIINLEAEISELRDAIAEGHANEIESEMGDVLFSSINVARKLKLDSDNMLRGANRKFEQRILGMEQLFQEDGVSWADLSDDQLDAYWQRSKLIKSRSHETEEL